MFYKVYIIEIHPLQRHNHPNCKKIPKNLRYPISAVEHKFFQNSIHLTLLYLSCYIHSSNFHLLHPYHIQEQPQGEKMAFDQI